jgi:Tol biopolymer transport system component
MDDLHRRFRRLDRVAAPNLWNEAVGRAEELGRIRRPAFSPAFALMAAALLMAALAGTLAVGAWQDDRLSPERILSYDNGVLFMGQPCGALVAFQPGSLEPTQLVAESAECEDMGWSGRPAWSADGTRLAYFGPAADGRGEVGVWLYEPATGERREVGPCSSCDTTFLDISADGSLVAVIDFPDGGGQQLSVLEVDSGEVHRVDLTGHAGRPVFSPDGRRVAVPILGGRSGVYLVDVSLLPDGNMGAPWLVHGIVDASELAWSPDGEWIAMTQSGGLGGLDGADRPAFNQQITLSGKGVVIVRPDGTEARILATLPIQDYGASPAWSADSTSVAYATTPMEIAPDGRRFELWTVAIDGGEPQRIHEVECCIGALTGPAWSPDGEWIAFGTYPLHADAEPVTSLIRPDGSGLRVVSEGFAGEPVWQPIPRD